MWDPSPTAGVLSSLSYQLTVTNMITSQVIVSTTTTDTSYTLPQLTPCQEYMANVTASSSEHQGECVVARSPGGEPVILYQPNHHGSAYAHIPLYIYLHV